MAPQPDNRGSDLKPNLQYTKFLSFVHDKFILSHDSQRPHCSSFCVIQFSFEGQLQKVSSFHNKLPCKVSHFNRNKKQIWKHNRKVLIIHWMKLKHSGNLTRNALQHWDVNSCIHTDEVWHSCTEEILNPSSQLTRMLLWHVDRREINQQLFWLWNIFSALFRVKLLNFSWFKVLKCKEVLLFLSFLTVHEEKF